MVRFRVRVIDMSELQCPHRVWDRPSSRFGGHRGFFPPGVSWPGVELVSILMFTRSLRMGGVTVHSHIRVPRPLCLHLLVHIIYF